MSKVREAWFLLDRAFFCVMQSVSASLAGIYIIFIDEHRFSSFGERSRH